MKFIFATLAILLISDAHAVQGGTVGNGGFIITCPRTTTVYTLDFILAREYFGPRLKMHPIKDTINSLLRIHSLMAAKWPAVSSDFYEFVTNIKNHQDQSKKYLWDDFSMNLPLVDPDTSLLLPQNCRPGQGNGVMIQQIVYRKMNTFSDERTQVVFQYDRTAFPALNPLQASFMYVHEWLWNYSQDLDKNMKLNYFLHSDALNDMSSRDVANFIKNL